MSTLDNMFEEREVVREASRWWWLFLLTGIAWLVFSLVIFRFDMTSAASIAILFGIVAIVAGVDEFMAIGVSTTGWKIVHGLLGVIFIVVGIFAFVHPGSTFEALAAVIGFFFLFKGIFDIAVAFATKGEFEMWWVQLIVGPHRDRPGVLGRRKLPPEGDPADRLRGDRRALEGDHRHLPRLQAQVASEADRASLRRENERRRGLARNPLLGVYRIAPMRRAALSLAVLVAALGFAVAGCGGEEEATPTPETVTGTLPTETTSRRRRRAPRPRPRVEGDPVAGKAVFTGASGCTGCHTLADAGATGTVGPNLDETKPSADLVVDRVTNGLGNMPSFKDSLTEQQIADVAAYISQSAGS